MSKYSEKVARRRVASVPPPEPKDEYSIIPDYHLRQYMRARAGMYGMTTRSYRNLKLGVSSYIIKRILSNKPVRLKLPLTRETSVVAGEIMCDITKGSRIKLNIFAIDFGVIIRVPILSLKDVAMLSDSPVLAISLKTLGKTYPLKRVWLKHGIIIYTSS